MSSAGPIEIGRILDGKYEILSFIGKGGMGAVYRVRHLHLNVELAMKTLESERLNDATAVRRFQTEAKAAFTLKHPNLVKVHDFGVIEEQYPFLVMDFIDGETLQSLLKRKGQLSIEEIGAIFPQLCFGLAYAHQQAVVHRDIKPANIMLLNGVDLKTEGSVKLLDFGIAKVITSELGEVEALTQTGEIFGSPLYMSPEQCSGGIVDHRSDIYSLGCVLFEALTGTPPLIGSNPLRTMMMHMNDAPPTMREAALGVEYSQVLERIVSKMLAKNPADRQSNLAAVALEIAHACGGEGTSIHADSNLMSVESVKSQAPGRLLKFSFPQLTLILFATIFASSFCTYMVASVMWTQSVPKEEAVTFKPLPKPGEKPKDGPFGESAIAVNGGVDKEAAEVKSAYERAKRIECKTVMLRGVREKCIEFPERSMGEVRYLPNPVTSDSQWIFRDASKKRFFPADVELTYKASDAENAFLLPNYFVFEKIAPDIFAGVAIERSDGITVRDYLSGDDKADAVENAKADKGILSLLKVISKWTEFRDLELKNIVLTDARLEALNGLHKLKNLTLVNCKFDSKVFARQPFVGWLKSLYTSSGDLSEFIRTVSKSKKLEYIDMGLKCTASPESIRTLKSPPNLRYFICRNQPNNEQVIAITSLTNLKYAAFDKPLNLEQEKLFAEKWKRVPVSFLPMKIAETGFVFAPKQRTKPY